MMHLGLDGLSRGLFPESKPVNMLKNLNSFVCDIQKDRGRLTHVSTILVFLVKCVLISVCLMTNWDCTISAQQWLIHQTTGIAYFLQLYCALVENNWCSIKDTLWCTNQKTIMFECFCFLLPSRYLCRSCKVQRLVCCSFGQVTPRIYD